MIAVRLRATLALVVVLALAMVLGACASVLGVKPRAPEHAFEHRQHVLKGVSCLECHNGIQTAGDTGPLHVPSTADCKRCHERPHDERPCTTCHGEPYVRQGATLAREHLRFEHAAHLKETKGDCVRCHSEVGAERPGALRPTMATCFGCHQHEKQWAARDCDGCHVDLPAERTPPASHLLHDADFIREHGVRAASARDLCATCHSERSCASCHGVGTVPALPARMQFDDVRMNGLHRAGFKSRHAMEAAAQPALCITCHSETSCVACHERSKVAPGTATRSPHPPGWLTTGRGGGEHGVRARLDPVSCAGCHGGAGEKLCIDCHRVGGPGGNPHGRGFTSTKDKNHDVPCRSCHAGGGP